MVPAPLDANSAQRAATSFGEPAAPSLFNAATSSPMAAARRSTSPSVRPQHTGTAAERPSDVEPLPIRSQARRHRAYICAAAATERNGAFSSSAYRAANSGVRTGPAPPTMIGGL